MSDTRSLNPAQRAAVEFSGHALILLAGAGSGKTHVITQRIARLISQGYPPRTIIAVTFTNKASEEMAERVAQKAGEHAAKELWISTFHALGAEIVRQEARFVAGGSKFVVYDAVDATGVVKEILRELKVADRRFDPGAIMARISHAKNALTTPENLPEESEYDEIARLCFPRYVAAMKRLNALDFDDLILVPYRLLEEVREVRERWTSRVKHLLVDEFQDTSKAQLLMVKSLAAGGAHIFCVGDDDQAIYGWRGAEVRNVIDFPKHFPGAQKLALEQNYRSKQPVLDVANVVIVKAERAYPKVLFSDRKQGPKPQIVECDSGESEAKFVVDTARAAMNEGIPRKEIAVLYRGNALARPMEEAFRLANIPYKLVGGTSFYDKREVKDLLAYLRLALNPHDEISFRRVVNYPARGIGDVSFERIENFARARGITLFEAAQRPAQIKDLDERVRHSLHAFTSLLIATRQKLEANTPMVQVAKQVADAIQLRADIIDAGPSPQLATRRWGNIEELYRTLEKAAASTPGDARQLLARLALRFADEEEEGPQDKVTLSTLHGSKGLEFQVVFLVGCDEGLLPHARMDAPKATDIASTIDPSEERRLFYVGVTRAKERLYMLRAKMRTLRGAARATTPSRFLLDIPPEMVERRTYVGQPILGTQDLAAQARAALGALSALKAKAAAAAGGGK